MALYAFDGTWNVDEIDDENDTNVCRFLAAYVEPNIPKEANLYTKGVGTKGGWLGKVLGGITGVGGWGRVHDARRHLEDNWGGEPLVVVGFSRGGALALDFVNEIARGIRPKRGARAADTDAVVPEVLFLGLWDVVASFGIPGNNINLGYQLTVPDSVKHCCHAMSLDERRYSFGLTRVKYASDRTREDGEKAAYEVWFRGGHSDVGGGNRNRLRSDVAFRWMMLKALAVGVRLDSARVPAPLPPAVDPAIQTKKWIVPKPREPGVNERVHFTVQRSLNKGFNDPPSPFQVEIEIGIG